METPSKGKPYTVPTVTTITSDDRPPAWINQCDGCRVGAPLTARGNHRMPDGGLMGPDPERPAADPGEPENDKT
jgi:hypothetical protein